jgi:hypothetical protein
MLRILTAFGAKTVTRSETPAIPQHFAAACIALGAILALVMVLHHPTLDRSAVHDAADAARGIERLAPLDRLVHGMLMLLYWLQTAGFYYFARRLGFQRPAVLAGFMAYVAGALLLTIPATLDGFVTPDLPRLCGADGCVGAQLPGIAVISIAIQDFTKVALVATAVATLSWAAALIVPRRGVSSLLLGILGLAGGGIPIGLIVFGGIVLTPATLGVLVMSQLVWNLGVAGWLVGDARLQREA